MKKVIILITVIFSLHSISASNSPQLPDYLVHDGDTLAIYSLLVENYLQGKGTIDRGTLFGLSFREGASLNCWRAYQAIYSISNDSLFLNDIIDCGERYIPGGINKGNSKKRLKAIFRDKVKNRRVFIDWYSGELSLPNGDLLRWDGVFHKSFENEILLSINEGKVITQSNVDNYVDLVDGIDRRFNDPKPENAIFKKLKKLNWEKLVKKDCDEDYWIIIGRNGKITKVFMTYKEEEIDKYWIREEYDDCIKSIENGLRDLRFDIIKTQGRRIEQRAYLELFYDSKLKKLKSNSLD